MKMDHIRIILFNPVNEFSGSPYAPESTGVKQAGLHAMKIYVPVIANPDCILFILFRYAFSPICYFDLMSLCL